MKKSFKDSLDSGKFLITAHVFPPKGINIDAIVSLTKSLNGAVDAICVGDNSRSMMCMSSLVACQIIKENGGEPIMNITCRDRNRIALQSDLLGAACLGINNVLCVTGDYIKFGDHKDAMPVYDFDSVLLLETICSLNQGQDSAGNKLESKPEFCVGAVANSESNPLPPQVFKFEKKVAIGIDFVQTQPVFNLDNLAPFVKHAKKNNVKVLAGIRLLVAEDIADYSNRSYPGVFVPEDVLLKVKNADISESIKMAVDTIKKIKEQKLCDGVHISAPGHEDKIIDIIKQAGI